MVADGYAGVSIHGVDGVLYCGRHEINTATPYYNDSHRRWQKKIRDFVDKEMRPYAREWDEAGLHALVVGDICELISAVFIVHRDLSH